MRLGLWLSILVVSVIALGGAVFLGKMYLNIIKEGSVPKSTKVNAGSSRSVMAQDEQKTLMINPIPVYYLQAGVYTDVYGAQQAAKPFQDMGYMPYITQKSPFRIWIGVYQKRADTEYLKQQLKEKGYGSFTAATVVNGSNLRYDKGNEVFIQQMTPVMEGYTAWLGDNLPLFNADTVDHLNWVEMEKQFTVADKVYNEVAAVSKEAACNNSEINATLRSLDDTMRGYKERLGKFGECRDQSNYAMLQYQLLKFVDNYLLLWQQIDNISKT